ncbi:DUF86 domain-containing protein [Niastella caeni]|uniref:DUF86 domain-containing protein n=1 Tax=Niastella caeni TaxID=2569763 RepID=A0A4S8HCG9_9BACT|nr:DUF86 domain-containing protein [Niastella caeni]THU31104.1 DUF86 domain-containing protein [Niastella caeni]
MKGLITDKTRVLHILEAMAEIEKYLNGVSYGDFHANSEKRFATIKQIEIIGEACNALSTEFKNAHPEIDWKPIRGFRNISIHEYFAVNFQIVWEIAQNDLPVLKEQFNDALLKFSE